MANGYFNPYTVGQVYPATYSYSNGFPYNSVSNYAAPSQPQQYMISVDGEGAAKAWQIPGNATPNLIIPLWDLDGKHVYFKSTDAYGRMNPLRKGVIIFEEGSASSESAPEYATKNDLENLKNDIQKMLNSLNEDRGEHK